MALSLSDAVTWAQDAANISRCTAATQRAATQVATEVRAMTPPISSVNQARMVYARQVFVNLSYTGAVMAWAIATDLVVDPTTVDDAGLVQRIYDLWPLYSETGFGVQ